MKVTREKPKPAFEPITIVIETEEEAAALWHRLNVGEFRLLDYIEKYRITSRRIDATHMLSAFSYYYRPPEADV